MNAVGSILACFLLTKIRVYLVMCISSSAASVLMCCLPFLPSVHAAIVMAGVIGLCVGVLFNCRILSVSVLWPRKPFALHLAIAGFAIGPILASVIAQPFLQKTQENVTNNNPNLTCEDPNTHVQYAFIILACLGIPLAIASFGFYQFYRNKSSTFAMADPPSISVISKTRGHSLFLVLFFLLCIPAGGIFVTYGNLFTTFGYSGNLHINVSYMALLTALFWATFVTGRLLMTVLSEFIRQIRIIAFSYIGLFTSVTILLIFGETSSDFLAVSTAIFGIFCAPFSAFSFSWAAENIEMTGFVIALGSVGEYTGAMLEPYIGGILIGHFGADAFLYVILGIVSFQFVIFICFYLVGRFYLEKHPYEQTMLLSNSDSDS